MTRGLNIAITLTLCALSAISPPALAEWEYVASSDFFARYIDPASAQRSRGIIKIWEMDDKAEQDRRGVYSLRTQTEYDCKARTYRIGYLSGHSKRQTEGIVIFARTLREEWKPVVPGSLGEATLERLCSEHGGES